MCDGRQHCNINNPAYVDGYYYYFTYPIPFASFSYSNIDLIELLYLLFLFPFFFINSDYIDMHCFNEVHGQYSGYDKQHYLEMTWHFLLSVHAHISKFYNKHLHQRTLICLKYQ
jgi:hypothetical protein